MKHLPLAVLLLALIPACPLSAQDRQALDNDILSAARLLDSAISNYEDSRAREREAIQDYLRRSSAFDFEMEVRQLTLREIRELSSELNAEAESLGARMREVARDREQVLEEARKVLALYSRKEERDARRKRHPSMGLEGLWRVHIPAMKEYGTLDIRVSGAIVEGEYSLEGGASGQIRGVFQEGKLKLQSINSASGARYSLEGDVDLEAGTMEGTYLAIVPNSSSGATGCWEARKLSWEEVR